MTLGMTDKYCTFNLCRENKVVHMQGHCTKALTCLFQKENCFSFRVPMRVQSNYIVALSVSETQFGIKVSENSSAIL